MTTEFKNDDFEIYFLQNQPLILKALYAIVVFSAAIEFFTYAWPTDNLMNMVMIFHGNDIIVIIITMSR